MQNSRVLCIAWKVYRAVSDESGWNGASTGTNSKGLWVRDARVHRKVDHSYMSAARSEIMTSEHGHGSQFTSTGRRVVPSIRWWQRVGLVWTVFWIIKYRTYWPDCNPKLNLSTNDLKAMRTIITICNTTRHTPLYWQTYWHENTFS